MRKVLIPKKSGGTRTIYVQSPKEKHHARANAFEIDKITDQTPHADCLHGFRAGRSPVTNALAHVGFTFTLSMDLKDFFDTVGAKHLTPHGVSPATLKQVLVDGAARQGLSSSPAAANLAGTSMDADIIRFIQTASPEAVYTRYADDLSISCNDIQALLSIRDAMPSITEHYGFKVNPKKTRIQSAAHGNRILCGVAVTATGIAAPRSTRRALRAAQHSHPGSNKTRGLAEWVKLKPPTGTKQTLCQNTWLVRQMNNISRATK